jgi:phage tail-like protein
MLNPVGIRLDPFPAFNFYIALVDSSSAAAIVATAVRATVTGGFSECSGLDMSMQPLELREGGLNTHAHKLLGPMSYGNITLKRGMTLSDDLWNWYHDFVRGAGSRRDGLITLVSELRVPVKVWQFREGLPVHWTGPTLEASRGAVAIEQLEIAHHGLELFSPGTALGAVGVSI